jgi:hypothetical protein
MFFVPSTPSLCLLWENLIKSHKDNISWNKREEGSPVAKWKLFNRSKPTDQTPSEIKGTSEENQVSSDMQIHQDKPDEIQAVPIKEYKEILYSKGSEQKQPTILPSTKKPSFRRISWESPETIERNVDSMTQTESSKQRAQSRNDTDKRVDFILLKKKSR